MFVLVTYATYIMIIDDKAKCINIFIVQSVELYTVVVFIQS